MDSNEKKDLSELDDFKFILDRSETIDKIKSIDNKVKEINYTYTSESDFSDEILYYLTQKIDKINQYKHNLAVTNSNSKSNFKITNISFTTEIDELNQYESIKNEVHYNQKSFNVHEHRKIPYEEEDRQNFRRRFNNNRFSHNNNDDNYNKRNASVDVSYRHRREDSQKNYGGRFHNFNYNIPRQARDYSNEQRRSMGATHIGRFNGYKNSYNNNLITYNPFRKNLRKNYEDDNE